MQMPKKPLAKKALIEQMRAMKVSDADWKHGRTWSLVYHQSEKHEALLREAYGLYIAENYLNPMAFRSLRRMEAELVSMTAGMLGGDGDTVGSTTSGGTESIILAAKTYRDRARARRPWIRKPEILAPRSAHVAFEKAAQLLGMRLVTVPLDDDFRVDLKAMRRRINRNTVVLVGSAPQFPQGVIDPIEALGQMALEKKLPLHVDSCIGGFLLPWWAKLGRHVPPFDLQVPGVTSISADLHKYGYASKGASVLLYRNMKTMRHQFFVSTDWPGGVYASACLPGTRPGGAIAAAWAAVMAMGEQGYMDMAQKTAQATDQLMAGIRQVPGLCILGEPAMSLVAIAAAEPEIDIYVVADELERRGWHTDRQQRPANIHVTVTSNHLKVIDAYLADLRAAVLYARAHPEERHEGNAAMYGMMAKVPVRGLIGKSVRKYMETMYAAGGAIPELSKMGQGEDSDALSRLIDRFGPSAMQAMEKAEALRRRLRERLGKWRG